MSKVGDYVRTKDGVIAKITEIKVDGLVTFYFLDNDEVCNWTGWFKKSSPNIIDLIEVGDYVNGCEVLDIFNYNNCDSHLIVNGNGFNVIMINDIKSIVTKEQFESVQYKVGEKQC